MIIKDITKNVTNYICPTCQYKNKCESNEAIQECVAADNYAWVCPRIAELNKQERPYKVGDRFIIEIGEVLDSANGEPKYGIKGFSSLFFDDRGLKMIKQYKQNTKE